MVKRIAIFLLLLVLAVGTVGALLPRAWHVERTIRIEAPVARVVPQVANLKRWQEWSVWTPAMDPKVINTYGGPDEGAGARWQWQGPTIGRGAMTIMRSDASAIEIEEAIESAEPNAHGRFTFRAEGNATVVTWTDDGELPRMGGFFVPALEAMLGTNFEKGLQGLKSLVEHLPGEVPAPVPSPAEKPDAG